MRRVGVLGDRVFAGVVVELLSAAAAALRLPVSSKLEIESHMMCQSGCAEKHRQRRRRSVIMVHRMALPSP